MADVERKRLHGLGAGESNGSRVGEGRYSTESSHQTYSQSCALAGTVVRAGYVAVVDGAFLKRWQRDMFREAAAALGVPFVILEVSAAEATLRDRIARRRQRGITRLRTARRGRTAVRGPVGYRWQPEHAARGAQPRRVAAQRDAAGKR